MIELRIRPPEPGDGAGIALAWCDFAEYYREIDPESFRSPRRDGLDAWLEGGLLAGGDDRFARVADLGGDAIGFVAAKFMRPHEDADRQPVREVTLPRVFVNALAVQRRHWRSGAGTGLMAAVERWAGAREAHLITLDTYAASPVSVPFYERRMGYRRQSIVFTKRLR
ncbi:GNAT family N-acetyltransferase [Actinomadura sp. KC216]|uniref:GNAT family N-acetyltransferase n=1 Tax=Actinomadura sp. KC216 TaxID=2530370 RepID=UPI001043A5AC|nr:GNAT family N-acetyltransferase [Actinomadura sp. KC216]TDB88634.1 GNAT family N-acetyltransferase [Actinomadura sp. KC216]